MNEDEQREGFHYGTKGIDNVSKNAEPAWRYEHPSFCKIRRTWRTGITMSELAAILSQDQYSFRLV